METSRTKLRREVREKRLAYFENQGSSPYQPKLQAEAVYQAKSPSKNPYKDKTKLGRDKEDRSTHHYRQQRTQDSGRDDRLTGSGLSARSGRPSSARSGVPGHGLRYPQGPSGDDCANVTPLKRKKNRPSSAVPSAHGDQYRLDIADSARLTGSSLRPSSAKAGARPKRPQRDPTTDHAVQRPSTASAYRSDHENARRQSEFADFRKAAHVSSHYAKKETSGSKSRLSDRELQDFFRLREIRQQSGNDLSPSSSEGGQDAGDSRTYNFFRNEAKSHEIVPESRPYRGDPYGSRSKASLENGISRRVQAQLGSKVENEALQASEFHSEYSAENMLQSLLGSRKVKAKLHDELLSSFLENDGYESILTRKRNSSRPRDEIQNQRGPDLNGNEVDMDTALLKFHQTTSKELDNEHEESTDEKEQEKALSPIPSASDDISAHWATEQEKQENVRVESIPTDGRLDGDDSVAGNKDEGEESGVEMDDLNFDVGALCNAAKQGDDILRQYIQGLTEKVKAKKGKESNPSETVLGEGSTRSSGKIDSLFAPKMPERKFDEKTVVASVHEKVTVHVRPAEQSYLALNSESDYMKKKEEEPIFVEDEVNLQNASTNGLVEMDNDHHSDIPMPSQKHARYENLFGSAQDSIGYRDTEPSVGLEAIIDYQKDSVILEEKETEFDHKAFNVQESFQDDNASVVSKVKEPAVTADLLEKLGLFDTNDTSFTNSLSGQLEGSSVLLSHDADSSTDDVGFQLANGTLDDSDLGLETFRPDSRIVLPLEEVRDYTYSKVGILTTSHVDSPDLIEEVLDMPTASKPARAETEALRRTYDMSEEPTKDDIADPNVNTPFHSQIQRSKYGVSFVFDPQDTGNDVSGANAYSAFVPQPNHGPGNSKHGIAFEVDLTSARKQPKPPPSSKPSNTRLMTPSRGSPKLGRSSPQKSRPRKSPRTPDAHIYEVRNYHEKDRRMRKLSSPRAIASPVSNRASESSSTGDNQSSLRLSLPSNMDTDRPGAEGIGHLGDSLGDSLLDVEVGAPFNHSPRREAPLEDVNEVLDRISNFNPPGASRSVALESQDTVSDIIGQNGVNFMVRQDGRDPREQRHDIHKASKPRPSSANPKKTATKKPGSNRPTSAHSKMYSSPDKSYDRKWPQSSMAWMTQHKLTSSLIGGDQSASDLSASGSKVKISQSRVNREFAGKSKPPVAVQMSKRDGQFVRVRSSKLFGKQH